MPKEEKYQAVSQIEKNVDCYKRWRTKITEAVYKNKSMSG